MPPKPFKPPRPSASNPSSTSKPKTKPIKSKPTFTSASSSKVTKSASKGKGKDNGGKGKEKEKIGGAFHLPSLSPDSDVQMIDSNSDNDSNNQSIEENSEDEDQDGDIPSRASKSKSQSKTQPRQPSLSPEPEKETIPSPLLKVLLQQHFVNNGENGRRKTRISKEATEAVGKYIDTFVREALARAAFGDGRDDGIGGVGRSEDGVLEVETLERLCPQLLLDF